MGGIFMTQPALSQYLASPEVAEDRCITFRMRAPKAKEVLVRLESVGDLAMRKGKRGIWSVSSEALAPDVYAYSFVVDGLSRPDPSNALLKVNLFDTTSQVHVPGPASLAWENNDVPHGVIHRHVYRSPIIGQERPFLVYTPPAYDPAANQAYPVLYLLHGFSDIEDSWVTVGRANLILDNLTAQAKAHPMLVVMPLGYGNDAVISQGWLGLRKRRAWEDSINKFRDALLNELIPEVEKTYHISQKRQDRAITGLSMGGTQSLFIGLNALDRFAWIGAFSSGGLDPNFDRAYAQVHKDINTQLRLLWIGCGQDDGLLNINQQLVDWLKSREIRHNWIKTPGSHSFMVWRRYLAEFVSLLFQKASQD
jgi:enterochelin esterase-like enzyme